MRHETQLIEALHDPGAFPHRPTEVGLLQTHISLLFFAGERVYKVKKPVDMGFLDYTTIDKRKHFCEEEVRLNRRLSPDVYLGVVRIVEDQHGGIRIVRDETDQREEERTIDYAVEMVRLPEDRMLPALIERDEVGEREMRAIAELLVDFHARCPTGPDVDQHATVESLRQQARDNFEQLRRLANTVDLPAEVIGHVECWCDGFISDHRALIEKRIECGRVREGHGDLHAGNICLLDDDTNGIVIYDCIEFTPKFRCRDVAGELGFLAMDMDYRGHRELGRMLVKHYAERANDSEMLTLLDFFKVHFAIVRSKVSVLKALEDEVDPAERREAAAEARRYLFLAAGYTIAPAIIVMCGLPATGKSTVARALAAPLGATVLRTDEIRKHLAGVASTARGDESLYTNEVTDRTYAQLASQTRKLITAGRSVVADATFASSRRRKALIQIARDGGVPWAVVHTTASDQTVRRRMAARATDRCEVSDADWVVYQRMREHFQPPDEVGPEHCVTVTEQTDMEDAIEMTLLTFASQ